jgi:hypothetical protein
MADIFISYKSERRDAAAYLQKIFQLYGYSTWFDYGLLSGSSFSRQIERELRDARAVVVLWCSLSRDSDWVNSEARLAKKLKRFVPVSIEDVELPLEFSGDHTIALQAWNGDPRSHDVEFERLFISIAHFVDRPPSANVQGLKELTRSWGESGSPTLAQFALSEDIEAEIGRFSRKESPISAQIDGSEAGEQTGVDRSTVVAPASDLPAAAASADTGPDVVITRNASAVVKPSRAGSGVAIGVAGFLAVAAVVAGGLLWRSTSRDAAITPVSQPIVSSPTPPTASLPAVAPVIELPGNRALGTTMDLLREGTKPVPNESGPAPVEGIASAPPPATVAPSDPGGAPPAAGGAGMNGSASSSPTKSVKPTDGATVRPKAKTSIATSTPTGQVGASAAKTHGVACWLPGSDHKVMVGSVDDCYARQGSVGR